MAAAAAAAVGVVNQEVASMGLKIEQRAWRFSRFHRFIVFKSLMGLERFEVGFFFREKFTKFVLALKRVIKSRSKLV